MTSPMPWVKVYTEILDDHKFGTLPPALKWRFVELCLLAGECDAEGYLVNGDEALGTEAMAWRLRCDPDELIGDLEILTQKGYIEHEDGIWLIVNFAKRQGRPQYEKRKQWRERKRRQREQGQEQDASEEGFDDLPFEDIDREPAESPESVTRESRVSHGPREEESREEESRVGVRDAEVTLPTRSPPGDSRLTEGQRQFLTLFGGKRYKNNTQRDLVLELEKRYGTDKLLAAGRWAALKGMSVSNAVGAVEKALPKWGTKNGGEMVKVSGL